MNVCEMHAQATERYPCSFQLEKSLSLVSYNDFTIFEAYLKFCLLSCNQHVYISAWNHGHPRIWNVSQLEVGYASVRL